MGFLCVIISEGNYPFEISKLCLQALSVTWGRCCAPNLWSRLVDVLVAVDNGGSSM
jgi:hypothetical protein